jgi:hypothetical protein
MKDSKFQSTGMLIYTAISKKKEECNELGEALMTLDKSKHNKAWNALQSLLVEKRNELNKLQTQRWEKE